MYPLRKQEGAAAIEFGILLPVLLLLVIGLIDFGHGFWHKCVLTNAAREGVRSAVKGEDAGSVVTNYINDHYIKAGLSPPTVSTQVTYVPDQVRGAEVTVTVTESYQFPIWIPLPWMFENITQLRAYAVMRHE